MPSLLVLAHVRESLSIPALSHAIVGTKTLEAFTFIDINWHNLLSLVTLNGSTDLNHSFDCCTDNYCRPIYRATILSSGMLTLQLPFWPGVTPTNGAHSVGTHHASKASLQLLASDLSVYLRVLDYHLPA